MLKDLVHGGEIVDVTVARANRVMHEIESDIAGQPVRSIGVFDDIHDMEVWPGCVLPDDYL